MKTPFLFSRVNTQKIMDSSVSGDHFHRIHVDDKKEFWKPGLKRIRENYIFWSEIESDYLACRQLLD